MSKQIVMIEMSETDFRQAIQQEVKLIVQHLVNQPPVKYPKYVSSADVRELTGWSYDKLEGKVRAGYVNYTQTAKGQPRMYLFEDIRPFVKQ